MATGTTEVVVIGGGISGTAAAYELARAGAKVTLLEQGSLASMASGWTLAGVRQSGRHPAELPLATAAVARWEQLGEELGADVEYRREGNLRLARSPEEVPVIQTIVAEQRDLGLDLTYLPDNAAVREIAPAIAESVLAASYCPTDGHANPIATVQAFAVAATRHGATLHTETAVTAIDAGGGRVRGVPHHERRYRRRRRCRRGRCYIRPGSARRWGWICRSRSRAWLWSRPFPCRRSSGKCSGQRGQTSPAARRSAVASG